MEIKYYGEWKLKWWQKFFYNPPRSFVSTEFKNTRAKAEATEVPVHEQFGMVFTICSYTSCVERIKK